jgi:hypothetical protein
MYMGILHCAPDLHSISTISLVIWARLQAIYAHFKIVEKLVHCSTCILLGKYLLAPKNPPECTSQIIYSILVYWMDGLSRQHYEHNYIPRTGPALARLAQRPSSSSKATNKLVAMMMIVRLHKKFE